ncbi:hypothetical protein DM01DRAFT_1333776 [Hesseltinella vesiculosa]|uniref:Uncharacterized protein n=1 Tax=Hesseltinella vesiculosa TaxID=101127 RepID=A0A1X2GNL5_9FUNG|nr:hypothetical protein DM01DRAFT_1333776 [Hesseltinella vesiculosa]
MSLWSVLQCQHCKINWDRDKLASWNMLRLGKTALQGLPRPALFCPPRSTSADQSSPHQQTSAVASSSRDPH